MSSSNSTPPDADADTPMAAPRAAPRWLWITLVTSVALNLLVIGIVAGFLWRGGMHRGPMMRGGGLEHTLQRFLRTLPDARRAAIEAKLDGGGFGIRDVRRAVRAARREAREAFRATSFDRGAYLAAQRARAQAAQVASERLHQRLADIATLMTAQERRRFLRMLRRGRRGRGPGLRP
ncbi:MAG: periplasmic heavy metal sensor [Pseudomonadota bacterium]